MTDRPGADPWAGRVGVYYRAGRQDPWLLLGHVGTRDRAERLLVALMTGAGDWTTGPVERPARAGDRRGRRACRRR